jgi:hypothetical protein
MKHVAQLSSKEKGRKDKTKEKIEITRNICVDGCDDISQIVQNKKQRMRFVNHNAQYRRIHKWTFQKINPFLSLRKEKSSILFCREATLSFFLLPWDMLGSILLDISNVLAHAYLIRVRYDTSMYRICHVTYRIILFSLTIRTSKEALR